MNTKPCEVKTNFEVVCLDEVSGDLVLRCADCGTVVFVNTAIGQTIPCPHCSAMKTGLTYWTQEEIEADKAKQKEIEFLTDFYRYSLSVDRRHEETNLWDWEVWHKKIGKYQFHLKVHSWYHTKWKGLEFTWHHAEAEDFTEHVIPLSLHAARVHWFNTIVRCLKIFDHFTEKGF